MDTQQYRFLVLLFLPAYSVCLPTASNSAKLFFYSSKAGSCLTYIERLFHSCDHMAGLDGSCTRQSKQPLNGLPTVL